MPQHRLYQTYGAARVDPLIARGAERSRRVSAATILAVDNPDTDRGREVRRVGPEPVLARRPRTTSCARSATRSTPRAPRTPRSIPSSSSATTRCCRWPASPTAPGSPTRAGTAPRCSRRPAVRRFDNELSGSLERRQLPHRRRVRHARRRVGGRSRAVRSRRRARPARRDARGHHARRSTTYLDEQRRARPDDGRRRRS